MDVDDIRARLRNHLDLIDEDAEAKEVPIILHKKDNPNEIVKLGHFVDTGIFNVNNRLNRLRLLASSYDLDFKCKCIDKLGLLKRRIFFVVTGRKINVGNFKLYLNSIIDDIDIL